MNFINAAAMREYAARRGLPVIELKCASPAKPIDFLGEKDSAYKAAWDANIARLGAGNVARLA